MLKFSHLALGTFSNGIFKGGFALSGYELEAFWLFMEDVWVHAGEMFWRFAVVAVVVGGVEVMFGERLLEEEWFEVGFIGFIEMLFFWIFVGFVGFIVFLISFYGNLLIFLFFCEIFGFFFLFFLIDCFFFEILHFANCISYSHLMYCIIDFDFRISASFRGMWEDVLYGCWDGEIDGLMFFMFSFSGEGYVKGKYILILFVWFG